MRLRTGFAIAVGMPALALAFQSVAADKNNTGPYAPPTYTPKFETPQPPKTYQPKVERPEPPVTYKPSGPTYTNKR